MKQFCAKYHRLLVVLSLVQFSFLLAACSGLTWLQDATNILPIVGTMITTLLTVIGALTGATLPATIATVVVEVITAALKGIQDIEGMVDEYKATTPPPVGLLQEIEDATKAVIDNINKFLTDTLGTITSPALQTKVKDILTLVLQEVQSFESLLPALEAKAGDKLAITVPLTTKGAKAAFNTILAAPTGDAAVDAAFAAVHPL